MDKETFNNLDLLEQVEYINSELPSKTLTKACGDIGMARSTIAGRFNSKGYTLDLMQNKYILKTHDNNIAVELKHKEKKHNEEPIPKGEFAELLPKIKEVIKWFEGERKVDTFKGLVIDLDKFSGDVKNRTFMLYENVLNDYINFCDDHKEFKKQDIVSQALTEFMAKYKKG